MKKYRQVEEQPQAIRYFDTAAVTEEDKVEQISEVFRTPLVSSYNWDYAIPETRIKKLYNLGKELNWNVDKDLDWDKGMVSRDQFPIAEAYNPYVGFAPYEQLTHARKTEFAWHRAGLSASGMLHGELRSETVRRVADV
jgi:hypothetical protein